MNTERTYTLEEQKANRAKLVAALRSGKYVQGKAALRTLNDEFCCLGVACDVVGAKWEWSTKSWGRTRYSIEDCHNILPDWVRVAFGFTSNGGEIAEQESLWSRNDGGATFPEIASLIESEPAGLFISEGEQ